MSDLENKKTEETPKKRPYNLREKKEKRGKSEINKKELDLKIAKYKIYYNECIHISNHLMDRYYGV